MRIVFLALDLPPSAAGARPFHMGTGAELADQAYGAKQCMSVKRETSHFADGYSCS
jgi:hypothetical protein